MLPSVRRMAIPPWRAPRLAQERDMSLDELPSTNGECCIDLVNLCIPPIAQCGNGMPCPMGSSCRFGFCLRDRAVALGHLLGEVASPSRARI